MPRNSSFRCGWQTPVVTAALVQVVYSHFQASESKLAASCISSISMSASCMTASGSKPSPSICFPFRYSLRGFRVFSPCLFSLFHTFVSITRDISNTLSLSGSGVSERLRVSPRLARSTQKAPPTRRSVCAPGGAGRAVDVPDVIIDGVVSDATSRTVFFGRDEAPSPSREGASKS